MSMPMRVAIIDDEESVRNSLAHLMKSAGIDAATFASAAEFLTSRNRESVDCILTDMRMPENDGLALQEQLNQVLPDVAIIFLTGHGNIASSVRAMKSGAADFLEKTVDDQVLLATVADAVKRSRRLRTTRAELEELHKRLASLTPRERQVFDLVTRGLLNKQIGFELGAAEGTIKVHRARIMEKLQAASVADLVRMAERLRFRAKDEPP